MASLRKIAQLAGVSPSTVTRALRNESRIGAATRARIQALAEQYHYLPNRLTQNLMSGRSFALGVLVPSVVTPYSSRMLAGILESARQTGYRVIITESHARPTDSLAAVQMFIEQRVDGILLDTGHLEPLPRKTILEMRSQRVIPIGLDATAIAGEIDHVHTDEAALAAEAVDYLLHLGHVRIAFVGRTIHGQLAGRGLHLHQAFQRRLLSTRDFIDVKDAPPYANFSARAILTRLLGQTQPPTAIIAWEDPLAAQLLTGALQLGLNVPRDLSLLGFGNLPYAPLLTPPLTTYEQHPEQVGQQAFALFLRRVNVEETGEALPCRSLAIHPTLMARGSCQPPR
ncbi:MAG TPA: LacI family DNA-binding transcriptional regulator [Armatimonadota bacterium]|jgi:DNA-binding LacI/PurR family transcriptional regulator